MKANLTVINVSLLKTIIYASLLATAAIFIRQESSGIFEYSSLEVVYDYSVTALEPGRHKRTPKPQLRINIWIGQMFQALSTMRQVFLGGDDLFLDPFFLNDRLTFHSRRLQQYDELRLNWSRLYFN